MRIKQNLDALIYDKVIDTLILGEYEMGEQILLDSFAEKFGVSRTPVVQAVRLLSNDGVLEILRTGRVRVPVFTPRELSQIKDVRLLLENYALAQLFGNKSDEEYAGWLEKLDGIARSGWALAQQQDVLGFNKSDLEFHTWIISGSGNQFLVDIYKRIQGRYVVAHYLSMVWKPEDFIRAAQAHLDIVKALQEKDLDKCRQLLENHILTVYRMGMEDGGTENENAAPDPEEQTDDQ